jgi:hypothetical protein
VTSNVDGKPITMRTQVLAEQFYWWMAWRWLPQHLVHDEQQQAFLTLCGRMVLSRDEVNLALWTGPGCNCSACGEARTEAGL